MSKRHLILGLGSNIQPIAQLRRALCELRNSSVLKPVQVSSIYESDALLPDSAPSEWGKQFLNAAVLCETTQSDLNVILSEIKQIEKKMGRIESQRWSPRCIDIDLLWSQAGSYQSEALTVPHVDFFKRPFALCPALEVYPELLTIEKNQMPAWILTSETKPFSTRRSEKYFWPRFVGILNLTTDSFSDGGFYLTESEFVQKAQQLIHDGAEILDLGAESTRSGANVISSEQEIQRLEQALMWIEKHRLQVQISIDSRNFETQKKILQQFPIQYINDVSGFSDDRMMSLLQKYPTCKAVVMHSLTIPVDPQVHLPVDTDIIAFLNQWWNQIKSKAQTSGIAMDRLLFDPGIGFGKTAKQSWDILGQISQFSQIQNDIYLGFSRKSFLKTMTDLPPEKRDALSALVFSQMNMLYCQYLRVHDVQSHMQALKVKYAVSESI